MRRFFCLFVCLLITPILFQCETNENNQAVATIGDQSITLTELKQKLAKDFPGQDLSDISLEDKRAAVESLLDKHRKYLFALENELDKTPEYQRSVEEQYNREVATVLYDELITNLLIPEDLLRKYYEWKFIDLKVLVLRIGYKGALHLHRNRSVKEALELAADYRKRLLKTPNPEKVVLNYTEDRRRDHILDPYAIASLPADVEEIVFSLPVEGVSEPVKTEHGVLIFYIMERHTNPKTTDFESTRGELLSLLRTTTKDEEAELFEEYSKKFSTKYGAEYFDHEIAEFAEILKNWSLKTDRELADFSEKDRSMLLAKISDYHVTAGIFIDIYSNRLQTEAGRLGSADNLKKAFIHPHINLKAWVLEAEARNATNNENLKKKMQNVKVNQLSKMVDLEDPNNPVEITEEEIRTYYENHPEEFKNPEKIEVKQIGLKIREEAEMVLRKARAGANFKRLYDQYSIELTGRGKGRFDLGIQDRTSRYTDVVNAAFEAGANQFTGPVPVGKSFYVVKTGKYFPETLKPLEEVKTIVRSEVLKEKQDTLREAKLKKIRQLYEYSINESLIRELS